MRPYAYEQAVLSTRKVDKARQPPRSNIGVTHGVPKCGQVRTSIGLHSAFHLQLLGIGNRCSVGDIPWIKRGTSVSHLPLSWLWDIMSLCRDSNPPKASGIEPTGPRATTAKIKLGGHDLQLLAKHTSRAKISTHVSHASRTSRIGGRRARQTPRQYICQQRNLISKLVTRDRVAYVDQIVVGHRNLIASYRPILLVER